VQESTHGSQRNGQIKWGRRQRERERQGEIVQERYYLSCGGGSEYSNPEQAVGERVFVPLKNKKRVLVDLAGGEDR
jgi:hypothetical protein